MAFVHPALLQPLQKLVESMLGSGSEGAAVGEEGEDRRDTQVVSGGAGETARLVHREEQVMMGLEYPAGGGGTGELVSRAEGAAVC